MALSWYWLLGAALETGLFALPSSPYQKHPLLLVPWLCHGMGVGRLCRLGGGRQSLREGVTWQSQVTRKG